MSSTTNRWDVGDWTSTSKQNHTFSFFPVASLSPWPWFYCTYFCCKCCHRWERRVDDRGRVYYVDHNTRTTTWLRPDTSLLAAHSQWQQSNNNRSQTDFNQRFLYPQQQQQMVEQTNTDNDVLGPLPDSWEKRVDKTGRVCVITLCWELIGGLLIGGCRFA